MFPLLNRQGAHHLQLQIQYQAILVYYCFQTQILVVMLCYCISFNLLLFTFSEVGILQFYDRSQFLTQRGGGAFIDEI